MPEMKNVGCEICNRILLVPESSERTVCDDCKKTERQADKDDDA